MNKTLAIATVAAFGIAGAAQATETLDIDLAGWQAHGFSLNPSNTSQTLNLGVGTEILDAEYIDLEFESFGASYNSDFVLSINDSENVVNFWDTGIEGAPSSSGQHGPVSETFGESPNSFGGPFTLTTGELYVLVYSSYAGGANDYHEISAGTLRLTIDPVPAPGALALLGVAGVIGARRRRRA